MLLEINHTERASASACRTCSHSIMEVETSPNLARHQSDESRAIAMTLLLWIRCEDVQVNHLIASITKAFIQCTLSLVAKFLPALWGTMGCM